jgi:hypothetical protein
MEIACHVACPPLLSISLETAFLENAEEEGCMHRLDA